MSATPAFRSIIVPVDGSSLAEAAIPYALAIAERAHSQVRFVLAYPEQYPPLLIEPVNVYLRQLTERFRARLGNSLSSMILNGPVVPSLARHAHEIDADLVVMTTHGWGGLRRAWLGSVADQLIRTIHMPVLVVRAMEDGRLPSVEFDEVLVSLDGSPLAETALSPAAAIARLWDAEMSLVQIVSPVGIASDPALPFPTRYDDGLTEDRRMKAHAYLQNVSQGLRERGAKASGAAVVSEAGVAQAVLDLAAPDRVSLIALATHGRGGLRRFALGSVADKLIRAAQVPVLVIRPSPVQVGGREVDSNVARAFTPAAEFGYA